MSAWAAAAEHETSVEDVVRPIEFDILFGRLKPRERLVEDAIMLRFGVKRHVVRRALDELVRMGIVVREPNRGATVRDFSAKEVEEIYELRELLQARAVERMALPLASEQIERLKDAQRRHDAAVASADLRAVDAANDEFHRLFFLLCGNDHLRDAIQHYAQLTRAMRVYPLADPQALAKLRDEHWAMIEALERSDRAKLAQVVTNHIRPSKAAYLAVRKAIDDAYMAR